MTERAYAKRRIKQRLQALFVGRPIARDRGNSFSDDKRSGEHEISVPGLIWPYREHVRCSLSSASPKDCLKHRNLLDFSFIRSGDVSLERGGHG